MGGHDCAEETIVKTRTDTCLLVCDMNFAEREREKECLELHKSMHNFLKLDQSINRPVSIFRACS